MKQITIGVKAAKALDKSIKHWKRIWAGKAVSEGSENCALCKRYNDGEIEIPQEDLVDGDCSRKCPIVKVTGLSRCRGTPYIYFLEVECDTAKEKRASHKMLRFLQKVRCSSTVRR